MWTKESVCLYFLYILYTGKVLVYCILVLRGEIGFHFPCSADHE